MSWVPGVENVIKGVIEPVLSRFVANKDKQLEASQAIVSAILSNEATIIQAQSSVIVAEAQGESWLQRNWRPLIMLTFGGLIIAHWFGFSAPNITEAERLAVFDILQVGIGGYVIGRSAEKIAKDVAGALKK